ncbi:hypothetical protein [Paenibacillus alba]|uniref:Uncharacterized protein n=1 Tax=Paenibacillus alba TaxID=1197127 RepID=A0ABU6G3R4_9BACL|nr:hypothetical protein [Paenibacillus alba]MEC0228812.1 hypothetical protein [Paenibacillus alba]
MYQIFQEYFKEINLKIFLKYDAERENNCFTVMLVDVENPNKNLMKNTNDLNTVFLELINKKGILVSDETNKVLLNTFINIKESLIEKFKDNLVFIMTVEKKEQLEYYVSIICGNDTRNHRSTDFNLIQEFINSNL